MKRGYIILTLACLMSFLAGVVACANLAALGHLNAAYEGHVWKACFAALIGVVLAPAWVRFEASKGGAA